MNFFTVEVLTPDKVIAKDMPCEALLVQTVGGQINILPEHTHIITKLEPGTLSVLGGADDPDRHFHLTSGICKVLNNKVTVLTNAGEEWHEIDVDRASRALQFAQDKIKNESLSDDEEEKFQRKVARAKLRIQLAGDMADKKTS